MGKNENIFSIEDLPELNSRIKSLVDYYAGGSVKRFSEMVGLASSQKLNRIFNIDKRNGEFPEASSDILISISNMFSEVNLNWLLTGNGSMLIENKYTDETRNIDAPIAKHAESKIKGIPLIPLSAMAGYTAGSCTVLDYECEQYVIPMFKEAEFLIPVKGQSMQPKFNSGDIVACKKLPLADVFFQWNKVYVVDTVQGPLIKRIKKGRDSDHVLIVSDNESYEPFELHKNQINAIAIVIGVVRLE